MHGGGGGHAAVIVIGLLQSHSRVGRRGWGFGGGGG